MATIFQERLQQKQETTTVTMRALVFRGPNQIGIERVPIPKPGPGEAVIRVTLTTICATDLHILRGEYPVTPGTLDPRPVVPSSTAPTYRMFTSTTGSRRAAFDLAEVSS